MSTAGPPQGAQHRSAQHEGTPVRRLGLIGCGGIAMPVIEAWRSGGLPGWEIAGVLARHARTIGPLQATDVADAFFALPLDLVIDTAGPQALAAHGVRALAVADVWTVGAAALADAALLRALEHAGRQAGHRLRVMPGAIAGLDGVAMAAVDPLAVLQLDIDLMPSAQSPGRVFSGSVREAAVRFPHHVNVAVAAALAGPGLDASRIDVHQPGAVPVHRLGLTATSCYGTVRAAVEPRVGLGVHPVAACIVAALRRELATVWVG